jgi:hypothetical protein
MPQRGDIVVERLTGKRAIVIHVVSREEITCRFADGRLEERFTFELEQPLSPFGLLVAFFWSWWVRQNPATVSERPRPVLARPSAAASS